MERRLHYRVRLSLPARLRWITPLGQRAEVCETEDVSRGGLRIPSSLTAFPGTHIWVTFPYDASLPDGQPEMPARVVRCEPRATGKSCLAVQFDLSGPAKVAMANGKPHAAERRASPRRPLALPVRVRPDYLPWFEEAMTLDISAEGLRFLTTREYEPGSRLFLSFDASSAAPWPAGAEIRSVVVRNESETGTNALAVSVCRSEAAAARASNRVFELRRRLR